MSMDEATIEMIVREVVRRLSRSPDLPRADVRAGSGQDPAPTQLVLDEPVVTTAALRGRLRGVDQLVVAANALVTPLVRDELKDRGIGLIRQCPQEAASRPTSSLDRVACLSTEVDQPFVAPFERVLPGESLHPLVVSRIAEGKRVLLACPEPEWMACELNRDPQLCAVSVYNSAHWSLVKNRLRANVVTFRTAGMNRSEVECRIREFAAAQESC